MVFAPSWCSNFSCWMVFATRGNLGFV
jgi:hypothetical protein